MECILFLIGQWDNMGGVFTNNRRLRIWIDLFLAGWNQLISPLLLENTRICWDLLGMFDNAMFYLPRSREEVEEGRRKRNDYFCC